MELFSSAMGEKHNVRLGLMIEMSKFIGHKDASTKFRHNLLGLLANDYIEEGNNRAGKRLSIKKYVNDRQYLDQVLDRLAQNSN